MAIIYDGGDATFKAQLYGAPNPGTLQFLRGQFESVGAYINEASARFMEAAKQKLEQAISDPVIRGIKALQRVVKHIGQENVIRPLTTIGEIQFAPPVMRRWVMAEPGYRALYHQGRVDGYSDFYTDPYPGVVGEEHYDYRRVMNGVVELNEGDDPNQPEWKSVTYLETLAPGDVELTLEEQVDILDTWRAMRAYRRSTREDPTSIYCNEVG